MNRFSNMTKEESMRFLILVFCLMMCACQPVETPPGRPVILEGLAEDPDWAEAQYLPAPWEKLVPVRYVFIYSDEEIKLRSIPLFTVCLRVRAGWDGSDQEKRAYLLVGEDGQSTRISDEEAVKRNIAYR